MHRTLRTQVRIFADNRETKHIRYHPEVPFTFSGSLPFPKAASHSSWTLVSLSPFGGNRLCDISFSGSPTAAVGSSLWSISSPQLSHRLPLVESISIVQCFRMPANGLLFPPRGKSLLRGPLPFLVLGFPP